MATITVIVFSLQPADTRSRKEYGVATAAGEHRIIAVADARAVNRETKNFYHVTCSNILHFGAVCLSALSTHQCTLLLYSGNFLYV